LQHDFSDGVQIIYFFLHSSAIREFETKTLQSRKYDDDDAAADVRLTDVLTFHALAISAFRTFYTRLVDIPRCALRAV
jgi:hypothetical protein